MKKEKELSSESLITQGFSPTLFRCAVEVRTVHRGHGLNKRGGERALVNTTEAWRWTQILSAHSAPAWHGASTCFLKRVSKPGDVRVQWPWSGWSCPLSGRLGHRSRDGWWRKLEVPKTIVWRKRLAEARQAGVRSLFGTAFASIGEAVDDFLRAIQGKTVTHLVVKTTRLAAE